MKQKMVWAFLVLVLVMSMSSFAYNSNTGVVTSSRGNIISYEVRSEYTPFELLLNSVTKLTNGGQWVVAPGYAPGESSSVIAEFTGESGLPAPPRYIHAYITNDYDTPTYYDDFYITLTSSDISALSTQGQYVYVYFTVKMPTTPGFYFIQAWVVDSSKTYNLIQEDTVWDNFEIIPNLPIICQYYDGSSSSCSCNGNYNSGSSKSCPSSLPVCLNDGTTDYNHCVTKKSNGEACSTGSQCAGGYCVHNDCASYPYIIGDGICDSGEPQGTQDCPVAVQYYSCSGASCVKSSSGYTTSNCNNMCQVDKYLCSSSGSCVKDNINGIYLTSTCNYACVPPVVPKWRCTPNGVCQRDDVAGTFLDNTCGYSCTKVQQKVYGCFSGLCREVRTGENPSTSFIDDPTCKSSCVAPPTKKYKCDGASCIEAIDGTTQDSTCGGACVELKRYKCENYQCVESTDGTMVEGCGGTCIVAPPCDSSYGTVCNNGMTWSCIDGAITQTDVCVSGKCLDEKTCDNSNVVLCKDQPILKVCGKNGKTYDKPCLAKEAGVVVAYPGACKSTGTPGPAEEVDWVLIGGIAAGIIIVILLMRKRG